MNNIKNGHKSDPPEVPAVKKTLSRRELLVLFLVFAVLLVFAGIFYTTRRGGAAAKIYVNGDLYGTYPLAVNKTVTIDGADGAQNVVEIAGGEVFMKSASCRNQICVHTGKISKEGQSIVCLPNRVTVEVFGGGSADYDSMTK